MPGHATLEGLLRHVEVFGYDRERVMVRGRPHYDSKTYTRYASLRQDSVLQVGRWYLPKREYQALLVRLGFPQWREQAGTDWERARSEAPEQGKQTEKRGK